jgi:TolB-like protein/Flp pilus assembly protein TadD
MPESSILQRLRERKLVQWALAYLAGAWVLVEATSLVVDQFGWPQVFARTVTVLAVLGFFVALVLAWYHGEKGRQRVSGPELLMIAALLLIGGIGLSFVDGREDPAAPEGPPTGSEVEDAATVLNRMPGIAVLPFTTRSSVTEDQFFTDGIQDDLLTRLSRVAGLRVTSRTSSDAYRDTNKTAPEIGGELNVEYILEGSVQRAGEQVRINVQLIDTEQDSHIWAEEFDRTLSTENLFDIQSDIVRTVAEYLHVELRNEERLRAVRESTSDPAALDLYLRGRGQGIDEAVASFDAAIERDSAFAGAHAELAVRLAWSYQMGMLRSEEIASKARRAAQRAVQLAPRSESAYLAMGMYLYRVEKDYEGAVDWFERGSATLLGDYSYHYYRANAERRMGRWEAAARSRRAALSLSPRSAGAWSELALTYLCMRRYAEAEEALREAMRLGRDDLSRVALLTWFRDGGTEGWRPYVERYPASPMAWEIAMIEERIEEAAAVVDRLPSDAFGWQHQWSPKALMEAETLEALSQNESAREKYREAADILEAMVREYPSDERYHASLGWAYAGLGLREGAVHEARRATELLSRERDALGGPFFLFDLAAVHAKLGEVQEAVAVLEDLLSAPARFAPNQLEDHFRLRPLHDDPSFQALMDRERERVF